MATENPSEMLERASAHTGPDLLTPEQASVVLGVTAEAVRAWHKRGKIPVHRRPLDGRIFVSMAEIREALTPAGPVWSGGRSRAYDAQSGQNESDHDSPGAE